MGETYCTEHPSWPGSERGERSLHGLWNLKWCLWRNMSFAMCVIYLAGIPSGRNTMCKRPEVWEEIVYCTGQLQRVWDSWSIVQVQRAVSNEAWGRVESKEQWRILFRMKTNKIGQNNFFLFFNFFFLGIMMIKGKKEIGPSSGLWFG